MERKKIVLIENQKKQFFDIYDKLEPEYDVYPKKENYDGFTDYVRIWVNLGYKDTRHTLAMKQIKEDVGRIAPDLFIIDYKLCGSTDSLSGLDLAAELSNMDKKIPIIFLSRTPKNSRELETGKAFVEDSNWVEKGYAGMNILEEHYFEKYVRKKIREIFNPKVQPVEDKEEERRKEADKECERMINELFQDNLFLNRFSNELSAVRMVKPKGELEWSFIKKLHTYVREGGSKFLVDQIAVFFKEHNEFKSRPA